MSRLSFPLDSIWRRGACGSLLAVALVTGVARAGQAPAGQAQAGQGAIDAVASARRQTVGVMPFANISGSQADAWIGAGIAETSALDLSTAQGIEVLDREAFSRALTARTAPGADPGNEIAAALGICRELGAAWLIAGGYQRLGDRLRITARLLKVETGAVAHTVKVDGAVAELFVLQDRVVDALGAQLGTALGVRPPASAGAARPELIEGRPAETADVGRVNQPEPPPLVRPSAGAPAPEVASRPGIVATPAATPAGGLGVPSRVIDGPPPQPPEVITRDAAGRATVRAVRLTEPLDIDGRLDDRVYEKVPAVSGFIQHQPLEGAPATEKTEAWVFFDRDHLYVSARCWDSSPESQWVVNEMRRDSVNIVQNEYFLFLLDTFYDRRNGILFNINPIGGRMDGQITDERTWNGDWNPIWEVRTGRFANGWTVEAAIPFKSLRYRPGRLQTWGLNLQRNVRWKNEVSALTALEAARGGGQAVFQVSLAGTLVGLEVPEGGNSPNLEIKPYAISELTTDRTSPRPVSNDLGGDYGLDVKCGVTQNLTADFTYNTDFAQVEADEQQVNLTSFSINRVELPYGSFATKLVTSRVTYTMTPLMFVSALLQYNSSNNTVGTNVRLRWEYQPGSELFVVYNDERDTLARHFPALENRAVIVKVNRLFRF
jgi:TolB-like protein